MTSSEIPQNMLGATILAVTWVLFAMSFVVVGLRVYSDIVILRFVRLDSCIIIFAYLLAIISQVLTTISVSWGMGKHVATLNSQDIIMSLKFIWFAQCAQILGVCLGRVAVVAYLATFHGPSYVKIKRAFLWTVGCLQLAVGVVNVIMIFTQCSPVAKLWNQALNGSCSGRLRNQDFAYFTGSLSAVSDLFLVIFPILVFWSLQMRWKQKVALSVLFAFGLVASASAVIKTINIKRTIKTTDVTYQLAVLVIWSSTEMYVVLLAGSVPPISPFFRRHFSNSDNQRHVGKGGSPQDDETVLTAAATPNGQTEIFASAVGKKGNSKICLDSTENILLALGQRNILMTTMINVSREN